MHNLIIKNLSSRITAKFILIFISGIFCYNIFEFKTYIISLVFLIIFSICIFIHLIKNKSTIYGLVLLLHIFSYIFGAFYINHFDTTNQIELRANLDKNIWLYGIVTSSPELSQRQDYYSVNIEVHEYEINNQKFPISGNIKIFVKNWQNKFPVINQNVFFKTNLQKPENFSSKFDYEKYLKSENIFVTGFTSSLYLDNSPSYSLSFIDRIKFEGRRVNNIFFSHAEIIFSYDRDSSALIEGIMLGNKTNFNDELSDSFSKSGISHIVAISGLHLNIIVGVICGLLLLFKIRKKYAALIIIPLSLFFAAIIGFSPSISRAVIMLLISMLAIITKRQYDSIVALFISAFILLLLNPYTLFDIGFILSFSATFSIIVFYPGIHDAFKKLFKNKFNFITSSFSISLASFIGICPFIAYYFNYISFASLIVNIWVIPLCSVVLILGYITILLSFIFNKNSLSLIIYPLAALIDIIIKTAKFASSIPFLSIEVPDFPGYYIFIYFVIIYVIYRSIASMKLNSLQ